MNPTILEYRDYRDFLSDWFADKKEKGFSYRSWAQETGLDASLLSRTLTKQRHLSRKALPLVIKSLELSTREQKILQELASFNREKDPLRRHEKKHKLTRLRSGEKILESDELDFFSSWLHPVVFNILHTFEYKGELNELAKRLRPRVSRRDLEKSLELLLKFELVFIREDGVWHCKEKSLGTGLKWIDSRIRCYQSECMELAKIALDTVPPEERNISALTLHLDETARIKVEKETLRYRERIKEIARKSKQSKQVIQLNLQLFPLSRPGGH